MNRDPSEKLLRPFGLAGILLLGGFIPAAGIVLLHQFFPDWKLHHESLHTFIEAVGVLAAFLLAALLLFLRSQNRDQDHHIWIICGLLAMGALDCFHTLHASNDVFIGLRCISTLAAGFLFSLVWLPQRLTRTRMAEILPLVTLVAAASLGIISVAFPQIYPVMADVNGYTATAKALTSLGGLFFLVAAARFVVWYRTSSEFDDYLFASLSLLFGMAGVMFSFSMIWYADWWYWHILRLVAFFHIIYYMFFLYRKTLAELKALTTFLEQRVTERTMLLSREIVERKQAEEELKTTNEELSAINRVITVFTNILDLRDILERVLEETLKIVGLEEGSICLLAPDGLLKLVAHHGTARVEVIDLANRILQVGECSYGVCVRELKPLILQDREEVLRFSSGKMCGEADIRFSASFPLVTTRRNCVGVLCVFTLSDRKPTRRSLRLLETVTAHVALLIEAARLHEQTLQHSANLEAKVAERTSELEEANRKLKQLDQLKSMFIASMSHELRTPLNSVIGFSSILLNEWVGPLNDEQKENMATVLRAGKYLLTLINDVIDVSKIEARQIEIRVEEFELQDLIGEAAASMEKEIRDKGLELQIEGGGQIMRTDRRRLLQCLLNLLSNAVKYTEQGFVRIAARKVQGSKFGMRGPRCGERDNQAVGRGATSSESEVDFVEISVEESGIGIREEDNSKIFKPFVRLESPMMTKIYGTGLGLYLTRKLVTEVLGGEINFTSEFGRGSRFEIVIPAILPGEEKEDEGSDSR
jgi:signal transduction histidine kinase